MDFAIWAGWRQDRALKVSRPQAFACLAQVGHESWNERLVTFFWSLKLFAGCIDSDMKVRKK